MNPSVPDSAVAIAGLKTPALSHAGNPPLEEELVGLFERFREPLLRYLRALGIGFPDGEEVVQEVFLALFGHLREGKSRSNLRGWIFRVAHNLGLKQRRQLRQRIERTTDAGREEKALSADGSPSPEEQVLWGERRERLQAVVQALREQDRWCLYLRAEGLRYREIAEALGMSLGGVSLSLARSLARLARADER